MAVLPMDACGQPHTTGSTDRLSSGSPYFSFQAIAGRGASHDLPLEPAAAAVGVLHWVPGRS